MSDRWRQVVMALVSALALAGGLWAVGAGWELRAVHEHAVSARQNSTPLPGEVVGRDRIGGVELDVVEFDTGRIEMPARVLPPDEDRPAVGDDIQVRVVMPDIATFGQPAYAADHVRGASEEALGDLGRRARLLLWGGLTVAVLAAFAASAALHFLWPDPKRRTRWHDDRYGG